MKELIHQNMKVILDIAVIIKYYSYISIVGSDRIDIARKLDTYTIDDIYALPDGVRAELIDGQIYYVATPT